MAGLPDGLLCYDKREYLFCVGVCQYAEPDRAAPHLPFVPDPPFPGMAGMMPVPSTAVQTVRPLPETLILQQSALVSILLIRLHRTE